MNNPIKVFYNGKPMRDIYPHATKWQVFKYKVRKFLRKLAIVTVSVGVITVAFNLGGKLNPVTHYMKVEAQETLPPVMERIAKCESQNKHYGKSGQVLMSPNANGTVDVGKYQINTVWFAKASELGLDITKEADNEKMAKWIYQNRGTGDWYSSEKCWK